jgi:hypothetical protein
MPTYFDPIMQEEIPLDESTKVYLVKIGDNKFCIKGISSGLDRLSGDPTTQATEYWPIPIKTLINLSSNDILFEEDKLTKKPLTTEQIKKFFIFDPNVEPTEKFNSSIKQELTDEWAEHVMQNTFGQSAINPHSFFLQPIFLQGVHANHDPDLENGPNQMTPTILIFHLMPTEDEEDATPLFLNMLMFLMSQEDQHAEEEEEEEEENEQNSPNNSNGS